MVARLGFSFHRQRRSLLTDGRLREYLGTVLRGRSPKFFGSGAVNLDFLAKRKSELWILATGDVEVVQRGTQREVVRQSDVHVIRVGGGGDC